MTAPTRCLGQCWPALATLAQPAPPWLVFGLAGVAALAAHLALEPQYWPTMGQWLAIVLMGIGPFTLANVLWDKATRAGPAATISSMAFLTPLVAISLLAVFGLGSVTLAVVIGACLAIAGAPLSART
ncbi:MAG: EamA family transporter [Minwuia sp.]|nr:EamA family transporter [Minwuia sp.]